MLFKTIDERLVQQTIIKQQKGDFHKFHIINTMFYIAIATIGLFVALLNIYHYAYDTTMYWISFGMITIAFILLNITGILKMRAMSLKAMHKEWKKKLQNPDQIEVSRDMTLHFTKGFKGPYVMKQIKAVVVNPDYPFLIELKGDLTADGYKIDDSYTLLCIMKNQDLLHRLIILNYEITQMETYHNETLKKVIQMTDKNRNSLFLQELMDAKVFLAVYLDEEESHTQATVTTKQQLQLAYQIRDHNICIYTDYDAINAMTRDRYPRGYLIGFLDVLEIIMKSDSAIFTSSKQGIILNPDSYQITFSYEQVKQLYQLGGKQYGSNRD